MTINTDNITSGPYTGNGTTSNFDYTFRAETKNDLKVFETTDTGAVLTLTVDVDYTVNGVGVDGGGTIDRIAGNLPDDYTWFIRADYDTLQETDFESQGSFFPSVHESAFDKLTFLIQQLYDLNERTFRLSESDPEGGTVNLELPSVVDRANRILTFDADGDLAVDALIGSYKGEWATSTAYTVRDLYLDPATNNVYYVIEDHTSTSVAADLAADKVELLIDAEYVLTQAQAAAASAAAASIDADDAETAQAAAELAQTASETAQALAETAQAQAQASVFAQTSFKYEFSTTTTMADPGTGVLRYNNASAASVTAIAIDDLTADQDNPDVSAYISSWADLAGVPKGTLVVRSVADAAVFAIFNVTGLQDNTGWTELAVEYVAGNGSVTDATDTYIHFLYKGADGADGDIGAPLPDSTAIVKGTGDNTKQMRFEVDGLTTGQTRTLSVQDKDLTIAGTDVNQTYSKAQRADITTLTDGATITPDFNDSNNFKVTLGGNRTIANPTNVAANQCGHWEIIQPSSGGPYEPAWGSNYENPPTNYSTAANSVDYVPYDTVDVGGGTIKVILGAIVKGVET